MYLLTHQYEKAIQYDIQRSLEKAQKIRREEEDFIPETTTTRRNLFGRNLLSGLLILFTHPWYFGS